MNREREGKCLIFPEKILFKIFIKTYFLLSKIYKHRGAYDGTGSF